MKTVFQKDIEVFLKTYRSFTYHKIEDSKMALLKGILSVVDIVGSFWESYEVEIFINEEEYPFTIPLVRELSSKIERDWSYHIDQYGFCCLSVHHKLILYSASGINFSRFYIDFVYPFFANHQFKLRDGDYAEGEYEHFGDGVIQYYKEELQMEDVYYITDLIQAALRKEKRLPNDVCNICGGRKYKKCCRSKILHMQKFGTERLLEDLKIFHDLQTKTP